MRPQVNPPIPQVVPPDSLVLSGFSGLKNVVRSEKLQPEELEIAVNIDLDDAGQASQRVGQVKLLSGSFGSAFNMDDGRLICVKDGSIVHLRDDLTFATIVTGVGDAPVCYVQVGPWVYWSSPSRNGKIAVDDLSSHGWGVAQGWLSYAPVSANIGPVGGRRVGPPPPCTSMCWNGGRIFMAVGTLVWFTDLFNYEQVDLTRNYWPFEGQVAWVGSTSQDIYVGTSEGVWYVGGGTLEPTRKRVMDGAAVPGSLVTIPSELGNPIALKRKPDQEAAVSLAFMTTHGYCAAYDNANAFNISELTFLFPSAEGAASTFRQQNGMNQYLVDLKGSGQPVGRAAFGAYAYGSVTPLVWTGDGSSIGPANLDRVRTAALQSSFGSIVYDDPGQITPFLAGVSAPLVHLAPSLITDDLKSSAAGVAWAGGILSGPTNMSALLRVTLSFELTAASSDMLISFAGVSAAQRVVTPLAGEPTQATFVMAVPLDAVGSAISMLSSATGTLTAARVAIYPLTAGS